MSDIYDVIESFATQLTALIEAQAQERARAAVLGAFGMAPRRGPGRPPRALSAVPSAAAAVVAPAKKPGRKLPPQFCPVPGCKNKAAPVFGMVCSNHKDVAKSKIKKYREARRAKKLGLKEPKASNRKAKKVVAKAAKATRRRTKKAAAKPIARPVATPLAAA